MTAVLIAEALAHAESVTPNTLGRYVHVREDFPGGVQIVSQVSSGRIRFDTHIRLDTHDAALAHLAERAERAEARATKLRAALDAVHYELTTDIGEEQRDPQAIFRAKRRVALTVAQDDAKEADRG